MPRVVANLAEHASVCCPSTGGGVRTLAAFSENLIGAPITLRGADGGMHQRLHHVARRELRIVQHLADVAHFAVGDAGGVQDARSTRRWSSVRNARSIGGRIAS